MPDDVVTTPVSLRLPADLLATLDKIAAILDRPRSWVMVRALRKYIDDEGQEVLDVREGLGEAECGEVVDAEEVLAEIDKVITGAEPKQRSG